jgi:hypothetical protein
MKTFTFEMEITGRAVLKVEAETQEEALKKFQKFEGESELTEWDFEMPYDFDDFSSEDLAAFLLSKDDEGDEEVKNE